MTLKTILNYNTWLKMVIDEKETFHIAYRFKFKCLTKLKEIEPIIENFEKIRMELIKQYGEETDDGIEIKPDSSNYKIFEKEINTLLDEEVDSRNINKFKQSEIFDQGIPSDYIMVLYNLDMIEE